jgi:spermidine synthase
MTAAWSTIATATTSEGTLELRRRRDDWLMTIAGRVLMNSFCRKSEEQLAELGLAALGRAPDKVLVSGLGMGFTLRALLDRAPPTTRVTVVELNPVVVEWCRGPLGPATDTAVNDPRVTVEVADVTTAIAAAPAGAYDLILLDMYEGPNHATQSADDPLYGPAALGRLHRALAARGVAGIWSEDADAPFERRFATRFATTKHSLRVGGRKHVVYLGVRQ